MFFFAKDNPVLSELRKYALDRAGPSPLKKSFTFFAKDNPVLSELRKYGSM